MCSNKLLEYQSTKVLEFELVEGEEKLFVYEFMPNKGLGNFIFGLFLPTFCVIRLIVF